MPTYTFAAGAWTQEQRNATISVVVALLWNGGVAPITHAGVGAAPGVGGSIVVTVNSPSSDPAARLTQANMESQYATMKAAIDASTAAFVAADAARQAELAANPLNGATLAQIDAMIDAAFAPASTAAQIKAAAVLVLKRIARYVRARGV